MIEQQEMKSIKCQGEELSPTRTKSSGAEPSAHSPPGLLVESPVRAAKPTDNHVAYLRNLQITNDKEVNKANIK